MLAEQNYPHGLALYPSVRSKKHLLIPTEEEANLESDGKDYTELLPPETLSCIFMMVGDVAPMTLAQTIPWVCKRWRNICTSSMPTLELQLSWVAVRGRRRIGISDAHLISMIKSFRRVGTVDLQGIPRVSSDALAQIAKVCPALTGISLAKCTGIDDAALHIVASRFPALRSLDITDCDNVTDRGILEVAQAHSNLTSLIIEGCHGITDDGIATVVSCLPELQKLMLTYCRGVTDTTLNAIAAHCPRLKILSLRGCLRVTDVGLGHLALGCHALAQLDLFGCTKITDYGLVQLASVGGAQLSKLSLAYQTKVSPEGIKLLMMENKHMQLNALHCNLVQKHCQSVLVAS